MKFYNETNYSDDLMEKVIDYAIDQLDGLNYDGVSVYGCDLHNEVFNTDYVTIGTYQATEELAENLHDVFEALKQCNDEIGEQYPDITNPERLLNLLYYMAGQELFNTIEFINEKWDDELNQEDIQKIIEELQALNN